MGRIGSRRATVLRNVSLLVLVSCALASLTTCGGGSERDSTSNPQDGGSTSNRQDTATLEARIAALEAKLASVTLVDNGATVRFTRVNVQIVNGLDETNSSNGLGNLIIGYNTDDRTSLNLGLAAAIRDGSHYVIIGDGHDYRTYAGLVAGHGNTASGHYASVTGGAGNTASGPVSSVTGGVSNSATATYASVSGGSRSTASGEAASVSGGDNNLASGKSSSVTGGVSNLATATYASVSGGGENHASGDGSTVTGGHFNVASGVLASVTGGSHNTASGTVSSVSGGFSNFASSDSASVSGGYSRDANGTNNWRAGGLFQAN